MSTTFEDGHARRQAAKRAEILAAATNVFFEEGYGRATMDKVLAEIGGSKRTLYNHFPSKEDLFAAIVANVSDRVLASLQPPLDDGDIRETLVAMGISYLSVLVSPDGLALYRAMISEAPHFPELARAFFANGPGRASGHLSDFIREQKKLGVLEVDDPQLAAEQFLSMIRGEVHLAAALSIHNPTKNRIRKTVGHAVEIFLCGVAPDLCTD